MSVRDLAGGNKEETNFSVSPKHGCHIASYYDPWSIREVVLVVHREPLTEAMRAPTEGCDYGQQRSQEKFLLSPMHNVS